MTRDLDVNVKDDKGTVTEWAFEGYPPNMLVRQGWKKLQGSESVFKRPSKE